MAKFLLRIMVMGVLVGCQAIFVTHAAYASDPNWTYEGPEGPEHWGELTPDYALCGIGKEQSPVDIPATAPLNTNNLDSAYAPSAVTIFNNGHTIQVNYDQGSTLTLENSEYQLDQFHFHAHSEHTKQGQTAPLELHLVHKNAAGQLAVVGVWLEAGSENAAFKPIFDHLPTTVGDPQAVPNATIDADALLPANRAYYRYNGSLTTPPCTEGVKWVMLDQSVDLSAEQLHAYTAIFTNDARPTQALNARTFLGAAPSAPTPPLPTTSAVPQPSLTLAIFGMVLLVLGFVVRQRHT